MLYGDIYSVPANTTIHAPSWRKLKVSKGIIKHFICYGPEEKANLLHLRVEYHKAQILPFGGVEWMYPFNNGFPITGEIKVEEAPYQLDIFAYNEDDTFSHEYIFYVIIEPSKPISVTQTPQQDWTQKVKDFFGVG